jgi:hypothetical protein
MGKIGEAVRNLRRALEALEPYEYKEAVPPKKHRHFKTFNGSVVYIVKTDSDGDAYAVVLRGGHKCSSARGEKPGEQYVVDDEGYYKTSSPGAEMSMSLLEEIDLDLDDYTDLSILDEDEDDDETDD